MARIGHIECRVVVADKLRAGGRVLLTAKIKLPPPPEMK